jgi:hypothetical protein
MSERLRPNNQDDPELYDAWLSWATEKTSTAADAVVAADEIMVQMQNGEIPIETPEGRIAAKLQDSTPFEDIP